MILQQVTLPVVPGLEPEERAAFGALVDLVTKKQIRNRLRSKYYDSKQVVRHLGIAIPPQLESIETVIGWPAKAVNALDHRTELEGFVIPGASWSDFGIDKIWSENKLALEASQAHVSAFKYAVTFIAVLAGGEGEPEVVVRPLSAMTSAARWDSVRRRVRDAISITGVGQAGEVTEFILYLDTAIVTCSCENGIWTVERAPHALGRAPIAALPYKPDLEHPFGKSRISRAVMSITDRAVRSLLRMEVSAEFYSAPQRYVLGADESAFTGPNGEPRTGWEVTLGKLLALPMNDDDEKPSVGQFPQLTMQPHMDMVRSDAALFAGETGIPVASLGIIHDNPSSDAAMHTAYLDLNKDAERAQIPFGIGWVDAMQMAVMIRDNTTEVPAALRMMRAKFRDPSTPTRQAAAAAAVAVAQVLPWITESEVFLEQIGYDQVEIERLLADKRRAGVAALTEQLRVGTSGEQATGGPLDDELKRAQIEKVNAEIQNIRSGQLGVLRRAGVEAKNAAAQSGMPDLEFIPGEPITIKQPE